MLGDRAGASISESARDLDGWETRWREAQEGLAALQSNSAPMRRGGPSLGRVNVPKQLPVAPRGIVGRSQELSWLDGELVEEVSEPPSHRLAVLSGMPGVGKTALAVVWAHRRREWFPRWAVVRRPAWL